VRLVAGSSPSAGRDACSVAGGEDLAEFGRFYSRPAADGGQSYGPHAVGNAQMTGGTDV
jgi:hypothetical protein